MVKDIMKVSQGQERSYPRKKDRSLSNVVVEV
jgi:hypothetical protein